MSPYSYITFLQARNNLAAKLYDSGKVFWTDTELKLYLVEALRTFNALTGFWIADYAFTVSNITAPWFRTSTVPSPRQYTLTDADLYTIVLYHIMEAQLAAGLWQGTGQFTVTDLTQAYEQRQNEILTIAAGNVQNLSPIVLVPNTRTVILPDNTLDVRRCRYNQTGPPPPPALPSPQVLWRADPGSLQYFSPGYRQTPQNPRNYEVSERPPLNVDVDYPPTGIGQLEFLGTQACTSPALPASVPLALPNDWSWVLKWGMLMDLMNKQGECQDVPRSQYCTARYMEGVELLQICPWLQACEFNNVPVGVDSVMERDTFDPYWETHASVRQGLVVAGIDLMSVCPRPAGPNILGVNLELVQSAPVPVLDGDFVQTPRDTLDIILDYAVHLAMFKSGGQEFQDTMTLFDNFRKGCGLYNKRIANLALFDDILKGQGKRQEAMDPRYA